jgi:hypothetical protein
LDKGKDPKRRGKHPSQVLSKRYDSITYFRKLARVADGNTVFSFSSFTGIGSFSSWPFNVAVAEPSFTVKVLPPFVTETLRSASFQVTLAPLFSAA